VPKIFETPTLCAQTVRPKATKFGVLTHVGSSVRNNNQILHGEQTICEEIFAGSTTNADARSVCGRLPYYNDYAGAVSQWRFCVTAGVLLQAFFS